MLSFKDHLKEEIHAAGTQVAFPHKGKMTSGKVVRYEKGGPKLAPHYVISHGEAQSATVPPHKVEKYTVFGERVSFTPMNPTEWDAHLKRRDAETQRNIAGKKIEKLTTRARVPKQTHAIHEEVAEKFVPATKTAHHYQGQINGKTYVVPHSVLNIYKKDGYAEPMRHSIVTSQHHVQHNNPDLSPEEVARVHGHIQAIHGGQEPKKLEENHTIHGTAQSYDDKEAKWTTDHRTYTVRGNNRKRSLNLALKKLQKDFPHHKEHEVTFKEEYEYPDPGPEKAITPGHMQHCKKCGRVRIFSKGSTTCPVCKTKKLEETVTTPWIKGIDEPESGIKKIDGPATRKELKAARPMRPGAAERFMRRYAKLKEAPMLNEAGPWSGNIFHKHQTAIAKKTLRLPDALLGVMGGPSKEESRKHLKKMGWSDKKIHQHEHRLTERTLTAPEESKKEEIVMSMKKKLQSFKDRYGDKAKSVMYGTATKHAKALAEEVHAYDVHHKGKHIDTIFYGHHEDPAEVKKSLVNHDGYHPNITVKKQPKHPGQKLHSARWDARNKVQLKATPGTSGEGFLDEEVLDEAANFMTTYRRNETANRHTANIVHLAKHFGDKGDQEKAKYYADELKRHGHQPHHEAAYELHKKLYPKAVKAHMATHPSGHVRLHEETTLLDELSKETLKNYIKKATPSLAIHSYMAGSNQRRGETAKKEVRGFFAKQGKESEVTSHSREKGIVRAAGKLEENTVRIYEARGQSFTDAIKSAKQLGHRIAYGTASTKWHTIDKKDRDYNTSFSLDPHVAERHGEAAARRVSVAPRHLEETSQTLKTIKSVVAEAFTRRHFRQIAAVIKAHTDPKVRQTLADHHADMFAKDNPRFDHKRFHAAAGTKAGA